MEDKNGLIIQINSLEEKIKVLVREFNSVKKELYETKKQNEKLQSKIEEQNEMLNDFQYKVKISKIVENLAEDSENSAELKAKIDEYIKEIDHCIAYLNKQM
ncbi:hypothetical protein [Flexithrix dorotheae]|uniref:hypothetical protein n=1 Tax=Flexithrix dorotheae TaxID=70993 RepID=UPI00035E5543|nr:hypothetical protein [Flexithrix dorotheae]